MTKLNQIVSTFFQESGNRIEFLCQKFPLFVSIFSLFFDYTSRVTYYLVIPPIVVAFHLVLPTFVTIMHLREFSIFLAKVNAQGILHIIPLALETFSLDYILMHIYYMLLLQITNLNAILAHVPSVREQMISKYGPDIFKNRGYNSSSMSPRNTILYAGGILTASVLGIAANYQLNMNVLDLITQTNQNIQAINTKTLETISENHTLAIEKYHQDYNTYIEGAKTIKNLQPPTYPPQAYTTVSPPQLISPITPSLGPGFFDIKK